MAATVLVAPKVKKEFEKLELGSLYTDANTPEERANLKMQTEKLGGSVIPAYYVIDPKTEKVLSEQTGATTEEEFLSFLAKGLSAR